MKITSFTLRNYRRFADAILTLGDQTTVLVGANNSGKTSCIGALHAFLKSPDSLRFRDISRRKWRGIHEFGERLEKKSLLLSKCKNCRPLLQACCRA